jgi:hypothetical protein
MQAPHAHKIDCRTFTHILFHQALYLPLVLTYVKNDQVSSCPQLDLCFLNLLIFCNIIFHAKLTKNLGSV